MFNQQQQQQQQQQRTLRFDEDDENVDMEMNTLQSFQRMSISTDHQAKGEEVLVQNIRNELENIPIYLTEHHPSFQQLIAQIHSDLSVISIQNIALIIYKMMILQAYHQLWVNYLKSGLGRLIESSEYSIWPKDLKNLLLALGFDINDKKIYLHFVHQQIFALEDHLKNFQGQLYIMRNQSHEFSIYIQNMIEAYLKEHMRLFRTKIEHQIELIYYDYHVHALKLDFLQHYPTEFQIKLMKDACESRYKQDMSQQEYQNQIQQMCLSNDSSSDQSFERSTFGQSIFRMLDMIENTDLRQELFQQYKTVTQQARLELQELNIKYAEEEAKDFSNKHHQIMENISYVYSRASYREAEWISSELVEIIQQRCEKISKRLECIHKFETQFNLLS